MLRGSEQHTTLMGGLSGFRKSALTRILPATFADYCRKCSSLRTDQLLLKDIFLQRDRMRVILDTPVCNAGKLYWFKGTVCPPGILRDVDLSFVPASLLENMDRDASYPGAVMHVWRDTFNQALSMETEMAAVVRKVWGEFRLTSYAASLRGF